MDVPAGIVKLSVLRLKALLSAVSKFILKLSETVKPSGVVIVPLKVSLPLFWIVNCLVWVCPAGILPKSRELGFTEI